MTTFFFRLWWIMLLLLSEWWIFLVLFFDGGECLCFCNLTVVNMSAFAIWLMWTSLFIYANLCLSHVLMWTSLFITGHCFPVSRRRRGLPINASGNQSSSSSSKTSEYQIIIFLLISTTIIIISTSFSSLPPQSVMPVPSLCRAVF